MMISSIHFLVETVPENIINVPQVSGIMALIRFQSLLDVLVSEAQTVRL